MKTRIRLAPQFHFPVGTVLLRKSSSRFFDKETSIPLQDPPLRIRTARPGKLSFCVVFLATLAVGTISHAQVANSDTGGAADDAVTSSSAAFGLLTNTCLLAAGATCIALPIGFYLAIYIERTALRGRGLAKLVVISALFIPAFVQVAAWEAGFGMQGWFGYASGITVLKGWRAAIWLHALTAVPYVTLMVMLGLRCSSPQLEEDVLLHEGPGAAFRRIALRAAVPSIVAAAIWIFIVAANEITITDVYQIRTYAEEVYVGFALGDGVRQAQTRVLPGTLLVGTLIIAAIGVGRHFTSLHNLVQQRRPRRYLLRTGKTAVQSVAVLMLLLLVVLPLFNLAYKAGIRVEQMGEERVRTWSAIKFLQIVVSSPIRYAEEFSWSMLLGQLVAFTTVGLAYGLAWWQSSWLAKLVGYTIGIVGLAIPAPILALTFAGMFSRSNLPAMAFLYDDTICVTWIVLTMRCFPFAFLLALHAVNSIGENVFETATVDGLSPAEKLRSIGFRQLAPFIASTWVIAFAWTIGELSATILTVPPGVTTISITMFNLVHYGVEDRLAGLSLSVLAFSVGLALVGMRLIASAHDSSREIRG